jgi:predicted secreted protein
MKIAQVAGSRIALLLSALLPVSLGCGTARAQTPASKPAVVSSSRVTAAAVWNPSADVLASVRTKCEADPDKIETCFLGEMKSAGASPEAVAFARSMAGTGVIYLRALRTVARVDVAYIQYAFRANELEGVLLVNGSPSPIDVDDESQYPTAELQKYPPYAAIANKYPNVSIWPADRTNPQLPKLDATGWGSQSFQVNYILRDGCHACAQIGTATFAFPFDDHGKFQGARVSSVVPAARHIDSSGTGGFETAGVEKIEVLAGKEFSITLVANHTTGYSWRLATTLDPAALKLDGTTYSERKTDPDAVGSPGEEVWSFTAGAPGSVPLLFEYVRPFEKDTKPVKTSKFLVIIE